MFQIHTFFGIDCVHAASALSFFWVRWDWKELCGFKIYRGLIWFFKFYFYADCSVIDVHYSNNGFYCRMKTGEEHVTRKWCIEIYFLLDIERERDEIHQYPKILKSRIYIEFSSCIKSFCSKMVLMCRKG